MDFAQYWFSDLSSGPAPDASDPGDPIANSLRFRGTQQQLLAFNSFPTTTKADACFSFWMKLGVQNSSTTSNSTGMICYGAAGGGIDLRMSNDGRFHDGASYPGAQYYRDNSGWYHCFVRYTASTNLQEVYMNGVLQYSKTYSYTTAINGSDFEIGNSAAYSWNLFQYVGYMADYHHVYGQALDPTTFGRTNANGVWVPVAPSGLTYGTNGFHLDFADPTDVGKDVSGNGNHFTATGFDTASSDPTYDIMQDSPTNNFATYNPIQISPIAGRTPPYANANLATIWSGGGMPMPSMSQFIDVDDTQTYYAEYKVGPSFSGSAGTAVILGVCSENYNFADYTGTNNSDNKLKTYINYSGKTISPPGGDLNSIISNAWTNTTAVGDVVGVEYNNSTRRVKWYINGTIVDVTAPFVVGTHEVEIPQEYGRVSFCGIHWGADTNKGWNFGQQPFHHQPAGTVALSTANMPAPTIANGRDHFQVITAAGADILTDAQAAFPSGLWWIKDRANANQHQLVDSVRGNNALTTPAAGVEAAYVAPTGDSVAWCWNAPDVWSPDGSGGDNGTIAATGRRNQDAGFSLFEYRGTGVASTLAHGLGVQPSMIFIKNHSLSGGSAGSWVVKFPKVNPANVNEMLRLNESSAAYTPGDNRFTQQPDDKFVHLAGDSQTSSSLYDYSMYCWAEIPGYSAFGEYTGNANADGPFVYTGFRPAFVMIKSTGSGDWHIYDSTREIYNPETTPLRPNQTAAESAIGSIDFLSNGFKLRTTTAINASATYVYCAWAENPFGGGAPAPAR